MKNLSLFVGLGAVAAGVVSALLAIAAVADPAVGPVAPLVFAASSAAFLTGAHRALRVPPAADVAAARSGASS